MNIIKFPNKNKDRKDEEKKFYAINWNNVTYVENKGENSIIHFVDGNNVVINWSLNRSEEAMKKWLRERNENL